ncbi:MAG: spore photoproduct lyase [Bacillota bacterium]
MEYFKPKRVFFEKHALDYPLGQELYEKFRLATGVDVRIIGSHNRVTGIPGEHPQEAFKEAKKTLVVGVRKSEEFQTCKPSAHYQLPLSTSCPGMCEYCYLHTTLGRKPYLRIYVNIKEILAKAKEYIEKGLPGITVFEGAATSDPLAVEDLSGNLGTAIRFFAKESHGRFRFATKFTDVESLLNIEHGGHTRFRFSVNTPHVINKYEHNTPRLEERIQAAQKVAKAGYPLGFIIGPVLIYPDWEIQYQALFYELGNKIEGFAKKALTFEIITHRYTERAKKNILNIFPKSTLPMDRAKRQLKYGQFGYTKYLYPKMQMQNVRDLMEKMVKKYLPESEIEYFV